MRNLANVGAVEELRVIDLGITDYEDSYSFQEGLVQEIASRSSPETLLLLEHPPVYTTGSGGNMSHILANELQVIKTNRGGEVTYHGPGQLVCYPLVRLDTRGRDLHRYLRFLEEVILAVTREFSVAAFRKAGKTGVWTDKGKLASIGVGVRRWVTLHGFALNVSMDTKPFCQINPCGIPDCPVTTLEIEAGGRVTVAAVKDVVAEKFPGLLQESMPAGNGIAGMSAEAPELQCGPRQA